MEILLFFFNEAKKKQCQMFPKIQQAVTIKQLQFINIPMIDLAFLDVPRVKHQNILNFYVTI